MFLQYEKCTLYSFKCLEQMQKDGTLQRKCVSSCDAVFEKFSSSFASISIQRQNVSSVYDPAFGLLCVNE